METKRDIVTLTVSVLAPVGMSPEEVAEEVKRSIGFGWPVVEITEPGRGKGDKPRPGSVSPPDTVTVTGLLALPRYPEPGPRSEP
jgi:hypothetical protein